MKVVSHLNVARTSVRSHPMRTEVRTTTATLNFLNMNFHKERSKKSMKVLIVYYSTYGNVYKMAKLVAEGVREVKGAEPVIRTVP